MCTRNIKVAEKLGFAVYCKFQCVNINTKSGSSFNQGVSHLYASKTSKNPGPLDSASVKNEDDTSPKAVSVPVDQAKVTRFASAIELTVFVVDSFQDTSGHFAFK